MRKVKTITRPDKVPMLNVKQVLKWLSMSERTLHRYLDAGSIRAYKLNGKLVFNPADIEAFLKRRSIGGGPAAPFRDEAVRGARIMTDAEAEAIIAEAKQRGREAAKALQAGDIKSYEELAAKR